MAICRRFLLTLIPYAVLIACLMQSLFLAGVSSASSSSETCDEVMSLHCHGEEGSKYCRELDFPRKMVEFSLKCSMATQFGQCTADCESAVSTVLAMGFGYRILTCDCAEPGTYFQYYDHCENALSNVDVCRHVLHNWCDGSVRECTEDALCADAKSQFERDCASCSPECSASIQRLYRASTSDRLVCDCDYLFNASSSGGGMCETSRREMLEWCDRGDVTTGASPSEEGETPTGAENSPSDPETTRLTSKFKNESRASTQSIDVGDGASGLHPLKPFTLTVVCFHIIMMLPSLQLLV